MHTYNPRTFWMTKHKTILFQTLIPNLIGMLRLTKWWYLQNSLFIATIGSTAFLYCPHVGSFVYDDVFALSYSVCKLYKVDNEVKFVSFYDNIGLHVILHIYFLNFNSLVALTCTCVMSMNEYQFIYYEQKSWLNWTLNWINGKISLQILHKSF